MLSRPAKFYFIEKALLPMAIPPLRGLIKSWRVQIPERAKIREIAEAERLILATYHGMLFHLLAFAPVANSYGRRLVVMTSPSYDGRLLGALLKRFGVNTVSASSRSRSIVGSAEFIRRIGDGDIGLIAVDGPQGPRGLVKPGFLKIAALARAQLLLVATAASYGLTFGTWDRAHLPGPFASVELSYQFLPAPRVGHAAEDFAQVAVALERLARDIKSPISCDFGHDRRANRG